MPAPRLPWFKVWLGATSNSKTAPLTDAVFRTWVELLDAAAQQQWRGRFKDQRSAAAIVRRPAVHVATLVSEGLIDEDADDKHLTMHDWDEWQRWRKEEDYLPPNDNGTPGGSTPERLANGRAIDTGTTRESPADEHTSSTRVEERLKTRDGKRREEREKEGQRGDARGEILRPVGAARGSPRVKSVIDCFRSMTGEPEPAFNGRDFAAIKHSTAPPHLIAETYLAVKEGEWGDDFQKRRLSVHEACDWVNAYVQWREEHAVPPIIPRHDPLTFALLPAEQQDPDYWEVLDGVRAAS